MNRSAIERTIEAVWHMESAKIIAKLARMLRNVGLAEEIAQDAWVAALEQWIDVGVPDNPGAWLMATAKNRAIDQLLIRRGLAALARAESFQGPLGPYTLQGAIAACHARARTNEETDWTRIVALYDALAELQPSPIVTLNRAVAVSMTYGPAAALEIVDTLRNESRIRDYHLLPSVRGDLLERLGRFEEARAEFSHAASLAHNARERRLLLLRAADCTHEVGPPN